MSTVPEIEAVIEPSPGETQAMLAALDAGIRSLESEPTVSAEDVRTKIKAWTAG